MENEELLIISLKTEMQIELAEKISFEEVKQKLTEHVNYLINNDFQQLVRLLYKVDVNEKKLRNVLIENKDNDAGNMIAQLIIERQLQKIKTRREFSEKNNTDSDEEKW
jgi:hypothetical protein